jgi:hypothetical protein
MIPRQSSVWDNRRNTSQVQPVPPNAYPDAMRALAAFRRSSPAHVTWIEEGYPTLTDAEHVARFGVQYGRKKKSRPSLNPRLRLDVERGSSKTPPRDAIA